MTLTPTFSRALDVAYLWHREQQRKGRGTPYLAHLMSVASLILEAGGDEELAIAGLLHDAIEDAPHVSAARSRQEFIRREFGERVQEAVLGCTDGDPEEKEQLDWLERKQGYVEHLRSEANSDTVAVALCDKLHNARSVLRDQRRVGGDLWERFTGEKDGSLWYYRTLTNVFHERAESLAEVLPHYEDPLEELTRVVEEIEERAD